MVIKDLAFAILNGAVYSTADDLLEAFQFIVDNGYTEELNAKQLLVLREFIEAGKVHTPVLWMPL